MMSAPHQTAWIYCAVSSEQQAANLTNDQLAWAQQTAAQNGWEVTRIFGDGDEGVGSGAKSIRKVLDRVLRELEGIPKRQRPKRIILTRVDRLGREVLDVIGAIAKIRNLGVILFTREDGEITIDRASDTLKPILRAITGALENEARSDKWKAVHARRRAQGFHIGIVPFGVVLIEGKARPYEPEASIVRGLFERAAEGWGYTRLARWAKEMAPKKLTDDGTERPMSWAPSTVKSILNSKTIRELDIVSDELRKRAEESRAADFRARAPKRWPWPLLGAVRCTCGKMLSGHCAGKEPWRTRYYMCRYHTLEPGQTTHPAHRADDLERAFAEMLHALTCDPSLVYRTEPDQDRALDALEKDLKRRLDDIERRKKRVWTLAEEGGIDGSHLRERLDELDFDRNQARQSLARLTEERASSGQAIKATMQVQELLGVLADAWVTLRTDHQQRIARLIASLPEIDGLYTDPRRKGALIIGADFLPVAKRRKADASRMIATATELANLCSELSPGG